MSNKSGTAVYYSTRTAGPECDVPEWPSGSYKGLRKPDLIHMLLQEKDILKPTLTVIWSECCVTKKNEDPHKQSERYVNLST